MQYANYDQCLEVASNLRSKDLSGLLADISLFERTGTVGEALEGILQRVTCVVDADRLMASF